MTSSTIKNSSFISADLREANFSNSVLENVDFKYAWFKDTILKRVIKKTSKLR
ncbi:MAG: pentapeptide repeat-containing protein [Enterococcus hulanensis]